MNFRTIPLLVLLTAGSALAATPAKPPKPELPITAESLLAQAHDASTKGNTELALRLAQSAIVANPARPASYVALGDLYAQSGQPEYARNFYDAALGIDPAFPGALKALAALNQPSNSTTANAAR